jgi:transposase
MISPEQRAEIRRLYYAEHWRIGTIATTLGVHHDTVRQAIVPVAPLVRFEGVPGEFSQHDFGMVTVRFTTGGTERVRFFASRLKWSRFVHVTVVPDEREEALVRGLLRAFDAFGGVPLVTVWDNPKTVVLSRKGELIVWNPVFGQVALDYRFAPELCWPRAGQQKGAVENLVGWVKKSFFSCRRFHDRADLEHQLTDWLRVVNTERPSRATGVIPAVRLAEERARLRPLPIAPRQYALKQAVVVSARARVTHAGHEYSMPPATIGQAATLHRYEDHVDILTKTGDVVRHPRTAERASLLPEHRAAMLDSVRGGRGRLYFQRQSLWELGAAAEAWLTELIHRRPARWPTTSRTASPCCRTTARRRCARPSRGAWITAPSGRNTCGRGWRARPRPAHDRHRSAGD